MNEEDKERSKKADDQKPFEGNYRDKLSAFKKEKIIPEEYPDCKHNAELGEQLKGSIPILRIQNSTAWRISTVY